MLALVAGMAVVDVEPVVASSHPPLDETVVDPAAAASVQAASAGFSAGEGGYHPLTPARILDTRSNLGVTGKVGQASTVDLLVGGKGGVPSTGVGAVVLNVTATEPTTSSFVTVWPADTTRPLASNLNLVADQTVANLVIVPVGQSGAAAGKVSVFNSAGSVHLVADVQGWFPVDSAYRALTPARIMDSRDGLGTPSRIGPNSSIDLQVAGRGGVPETDVGAVVINVTAAEPTMSSFVTVWPTGATRPLASNLNVTAGQNVPNLVIVPVGQSGAAAGKVSLYNQQGTIDLVADVQGWFPVSTASDYTGAAPFRILDTREGIGGASSLGTGGSLELLVVGVGSVPATGVTAVALNVTATNGDRPSYVTVWPAGGARPLASNLNTTRAGHTVANLVIVPVGADGKVSLFNFDGTIDLVADVQGWFTTTTTTPPPDDPEQPEQWVPRMTGGWHFVPEALTLTAAGEVGTVRLVFVDASGAVTETPLPHGVVFDTVGDDSIAALTYDPDGTVHVTADPTRIGAFTLTATIAGQAIAATAAITTARLRAGVQSLTDDQIVYPPTMSFDQDAGPEAGYVGPFTIAEMVARLHVPVDLSANGGGALLDPDSHFPVVLIGAAPAVGTIVASGGAKSVFGRVIEPPGAPLLTRGGHSLVTVEQIPLEQIFAQLEIDYSSDALVAVGAESPGESYDFGCLPDGVTNPEGDPALACGDSAVAPVPGVQAATGAIELKSGPVRGALPETDPNIQMLKKLEKLLRCINNSTLGLTVAEIKLFDGTVEAGPYMNFDISIDEDKLAETEEVVLQSLSMETGFRVQMSGGPSAKLQAAITGHLQCSLKEFLIRDFFPKHPIAAMLVSATLYGHYDVILDVKASAGPSATVSASCTVFKEIAIGFTYTPAAGVQGYKKNEDPAITCAPSVAVSSDVDQAQIDVSVGPAAVLEAGIRIGGILSVAVSMIAKSWDINLGQVGFRSILTGTLWPRAHVIWENDKYVLGAGKASSLAGVDAEFKVDLSTFDPLNWLIAKLTGARASGDLVLVSIKVDIVSLYRPLNSTGIVIKVNGEQVSADNTVMVELGDEVEVVSTMTAPTPLLPLTLPLITGGSDWILDGSSHSSFGFFDNYQQISPGGTSLATMRSEVEVSRALCDTLGKDKSRRITLLADTPYIPGVLGAAGFAGSFRMQCRAPELTWVPAKVTLSFDAATLAQTVQLTGKAVKGYDFELVTDGDPLELPDWLTDVTPLEGTFHVQLDTNQEVGLVGDCTGLAGKLLTHTFNAKAWSPGAAADAEPDARADLAVELDCRHGWVKVAPATVNTSLPLTITSKGADSQEWTMTGLPAWPELEIANASGEFAAGQTTTIDEVFLPKRPKTCELQGTDSAVVTIDGGIRGNAQFTLVRQAVAADASQNCTPLTAYGTGDPHMTSFDGGYFDAQVRGEYIYARTSPGAAVPITIIARHEPTDPRPRLWAPTSITAIAVEVGGHQVEVYARIDGVGVAGAPPVYVDGVEIEMRQSVPIEIAPNFSVTMKGWVVSVNGPGIQVSAKLAGSLLDVAISADQGLPVTGFLGSPDRNQANDFTAADGTAFTLSQLQQHDDELYAFTDSWRLEDEADSPFAVPYDDFGTDNPAFTREDLAPFRAQAAALLDGISSVCNAGEGVESHVLDGLALELSIGRTPADLVGYSCTYVVRGLAQSGDSPIPGLDVIVTVAGLTTCITTTGSDGRYQCVLTPDLAAIALDPPPLGIPLTASAEARFHGTATVLTSGSADFPGRAPVGAGSVGAFVDLDIDPSLLPNAVVAGNLFRAGSPLIGTVPMTITGLAANGTVLVTLRQNVTPDPSTGAYTFTKVLPLGTQRVNVRAEIGMTWTDHLTVTVGSAEAPLVNGPNPVPFTFNYNPPLVTVRGTMTGFGGEPLAGPITIRVMAYAGDQFVTYQQVTVTPGAGGAYTTTPVVLPVSTTRVHAIAQIGVVTGDWVTSASVAAGPGAVDVPLDVDYRPPSLAISGTLLIADGMSTSPITTATTFTVRAFDGVGSPVYTQTRQVTPNSAGDYSLNEILPRSAVRATVTAHIGVVAADYVTVEQGALVLGHNALALNVTYGPPVVVVSGALVDGLGNGLAHLPIAITVYNGTTVALTASSIVTPAVANGAYTVSFALPLQWTRVVATAVVGAFVADRFSAELAQFSTGIRSLALSGMYHPPIAKVSGSLIRGDGTKVTTAQLFTFVSRDSGGAELATQLATATPNAEGLYTGLDVTLPRLTTEVDVLVNIGTFSQDLVTTTRAVLPGVNPITFDVALNTPRLRLSGTFTRDGQPFGDDVTLFYQAYGGVDGQTAIGPQLNRTITSATNTYSIDINLPTGATRFRARGQLGGFFDDDLHIDQIGLVDGLNLLTADIADVSRTLQLAGTVVRNGQPLINTTLPIYTWHRKAAEGSTYSYEPRTIWITTDASGGYSFDVALPRQAVGIEMQFRAPSAYPDEGDVIVAHTIDGLHDGVNAAATFDVVYNERLLALAGTITDDAAVAGPTTLSVRFTDGSGASYGTRELLVTPTVPDGLYGGSIRIPAGATIANVTPRVGPTFDWVEQSVPLQSTGDSAGTVSIAHDSAIATSAGRLRHSGVPADSLTITVIGQTASGQEIGRASNTIEIDDAEGDYAGMVIGVFPNTSHKVRVLVSYRLANGATRYFETGSDVTPGADYLQSINADTQAVRIAGRIVNAATLEVLDPAQSPLDYMFWNYVGETQSSGWYAQMSWGTDGRFVIDMDSPVDADSGQLQIGDGPVVTVPIDRVVGVTEYDIGDYQYVVASRLLLSGVITVQNEFGVEDPSLLPQTVEVEVIPYRFDVAEFDSPTPYERLATLAPTTSTITLDEYDRGAYAVSVALPLDTNLIEVRVRLDGADDFFSNGFLLADPAQQYQVLGFDIADTPNHFTVDYQTRLGTGHDDCVSATPRGFLFNVSFGLRAKADVGSEPSWFVGPSLVIPDPVTGLARLRVAVPVTEVGGAIDEIVHREDDAEIYAGIENMENTSGSGGWDITPGEIGVDRGVGATHDRHCSG